MGLHRPNRSPSQRYRFEQFQPFLKANGFEIDYFYLIRAQDDRAFYSAGNYLKKVWILCRSLIKLTALLFRTRQYALIFVQREAFMLGTTFFERQLAKRNKMVFDFDDSIWLHNVSKGNSALAFLKNASKTQELIAIADLVFAGNSFLQNYALQFNANSQLVPTVVDAEIYKNTPNLKQTNKQQTGICIGWTGSFSTIPYFEQLLPVLHQIKEKYGDQVYFKVIGDANYQYEPLGIQGIAWNNSKEVADLAEIDIGIMPLPNDDWTKGKCALKGLLYLSMGQAAVLADVGVNGTVIQHGENGFLAANEAKWVQALSRLVEDADLRQQFGKAGRQTILERYSVQSEQARYLQFLEQLIEA